MGFDLSIDLLTLISSYLDILLNIDLLSESVSILNCSLHIQVSHYRPAKAA